LIEILFLRLTGHDQTAGVVDGGLEHLARPEHEGELDNGKEHGEEWNDDNREFDRGSTVILAAETDDQAPQAARRAGCFFSAKFDTEHGCGPRFMMTLIATTT
jgi:hypothetical protein